MRTTKEQYLEELTELENQLADGIITDAEYDKRIKSLRKIYGIDKDEE